MEENDGSAAQSCPQGSALFSVSDENNAIVLVTLLCSSTVTVQPLLLSSLSQVLGALRGMYIRQRRSTRRWRRTNVRCLRTVNDIVCTSLYGVYTVSIRLYSKKNSLLYSFYTKILLYDLLIYLSTLKYRNFVELLLFPIKCDTISYVGY